MPVPSEPLTEEEAAQWKILSAHPEYCKDFAEVVENKVENERREQEEFLETVRAQIYEDHVA